MNKVKTLIDIYREKGIKSSGIEIKDYFLFGDGAVYTKGILGKKYHHKLHIYNQLGYWPKIETPRTFNEKIIHRKLYTDNELFSIVADKWRVREYVAEKVGDEILSEVYHVTDDPDTISFDELPDEYVIKPTHMSGRIIIVGEDEDPDHNSIKRSCRKWLNTTYGSMQEEYWYGEIKPRIIIEERLKDDGYYLPIGYDFFVFHGEVKAVCVYQKTSENVEKTINYYTTDWDKINIIKRGDFKRGEDLSKPKKLDEMIEVAEALGDYFNHIRVDLYSPNNQHVVFGELTVADGAGEMQFVPQEYDFKFGSYW